MNDKYCVPLNKLIEELVPNLTKGQIRRLYWNVRFHDMIRKTKKAIVKPKVELIIQMLIHLTMMENPCKRFRLYVSKRYIQNK